MKSESEKAASHRIAKRKHLDFLRANYTFIQLRRIEPAVKAEFIAIAELNKCTQSEAFKKIVKHYQSLGSKLKCEKK